MLQRLTFDRAQKHYYGALTLKHAGKHRDTLFRERVGEVSAQAAF
jgi:hypothetical protein